MNTIGHKMRFLKEVIPPRVVRISQSTAIWMTVCAIFLVTGCSRLQAARGKLGLATRPEAVVNGEPITSDEYFEALKTAPEAANILNQLILQKLVEQEAHKESIHLNERELSELRAESVRLGADSRASTFDRDTRSAILLKAIIVAKLPPGNIRKLYDTFPKELAQYQVSHILCGDYAESERVEQELKNGRTFEVLAAEYSHDTSTRPVKGYLGWLIRGQLRELGDPVEATITSLSVGQVSAPVKTKGGLAIFKLTGKRTTFEELKSSLEDRLAAAEEPNIIRELYAHASITSPYLQSDSTAAGPRGTPTPGSSPLERRVNPDLANPAPRASVSPAILPEGSRTTNPVDSARKNGSVPGPPIPSTVRDTPAPENTGRP